MTPFLRFARPAVLAALALGLSGAAVSAAASSNEPATDRAPCFFSRNWDGWSAPDDRTLYLNVNRHDVYRVDLVGETSMLRSPGVHLVFRAHGGDSICSHLDLDLSVSDGHGMSTPLIARRLTKLTPEEVAAIPPKLRP